MQDISDHDAELLKRVFFIKGKTVGCFADIEEAERGFQLLANLTEDQFEPFAERVGVPTKLVWALNGVTKQAGLAIQNVRSKHGRLAPELFANVAKEALQQKQQGQKQTKEQTAILLGSQHVLSRVRGWHEHVPWDDLKALANRGN